MGGLREADHAQELRIACQCSARGAAHSRWRGRRLGAGDVAPQPSGMDGSQPVPNAARGQARRQEDTAQLATHLLLHSSLPSARAVLWAQPAGAARARVQARAGSRPGSRAAMARPAVDRVGVQPPGRHRRSRCASTGPDACVARPRTACGWHGCCAHVQSYANSRRSDPCRRCRGERGRLGLRGVSCRAAREDGRDFGWKIGWSGGCAGTRHLSSFERLVLNPMDGA